MTAAQNLPRTMEAGDARFVVVLECDLSLNTGYSINERESAVALLDHFPGRVRVICPAPAAPAVFHDQRIDYVRDHRRYNPLAYVLFLRAVAERLARVCREIDPAAVVFRLGPLPIIPALTVFG